MTLGDRLRELRKDNGKSQKDFGKIFGLSESAIGMYERNERKPDYETLRKIATSYSVSTDYLIYGAEKTTDPLVIKEDSATYNYSTKTGVNYADDIEVMLSPEDIKVLKELRKHPILFNEIKSNPEKKIKELIKLQKARKFLLEDEEEDPVNGFGDIED